MDHIEPLQRTDDWHAARLGKVTASRIADVALKLKNGSYSVNRAGYLAELVIERITGKPATRYVSPAMVHGTNTEAEALTNYAFLCQVDVEPAPFVPHPAIPMSGASPDGYVGADGLVETKCPQPIAHIARLRGEPAPEKYVLQALWQMECTGRAWCDLVHYHPVFPGPMQLHVERVRRDDARIAELTKEVVTFLAEVDEAVADLQTRYAA